MAYEVPGLLLPFPAAVDFREAKQFCFVGLTATGKVNTAGAGGTAIGVRQNRPRQDEATTVMVSGVSFVEAGGALAPGDPVAADATGRAVKAVAGNSVLGVALEAAPAAGIQIAVLLSTPTATV
jgi:hypothetical protein